MKKQEKTKVQAVDTTPVYEGTSEIALEDLIPHPFAIAIPVSEDDRKCAAESMNAMGYDPLTVCKHDKLAGKYYVLDGIGRLEWLAKKQAWTAVCNIFEMNGADLNEFCITRNTMRRKVTTGQRVMAYLDLHRMAVLDAAMENADPSKSGAKSKGVSLRLPFTPEAIADRLHVSKQDVLSGIQLLRAMHTGTFPVTDEAPDGRKVLVWDKANDKQVDAMKTSLDNIMKGETPIRRWRPAAASSASTTGTERAPTDHARLLADAVSVIRREISSIHDMSPEAQLSFVRTWRKLVITVNEHTAKVVSA